jgi:DNA-binding transcriptional LysR family regulator
MQDLSDLAFVAAVTRTGSLAGAARQLQVNHATVFRRIAALEAALGVQLFDRNNGRYVATLAGEELAATGALIAEHAERSLRKVAGYELQPSGIVRITTTDSIANHLLNPALQQCRAAYPEISLHVSIDNAMLDLSRRDADIAVRATLRPPDYLIGKRIAPVAFAVYGAGTYLMEHQSTTDLAAHHWLSLGDAYERHRSLLWLQRIVPLERVGLRTDGFASLAQACKDGLGLAVLPCWIGDAAAELYRVEEPQSDLASELWLLTHPDLRNVPRVRAVFKTLQTALGLHKKALEGLGPCQGWHKTILAP